MPSHAVACLSIAGLAALLFAGLSSARADQPAIDGFALGITPDQAMTATHLPCVKPPYTGEVTCRDDADGSNYKLIFSAGDPSVALSVERSFCSHASTQQVLDQALKTLKVAPDRAHRDPNGWHFDLDGNNEAVLNADDGTCPNNGGKHYILLIRGDTLINTSDKQAVERAKKAMH